MKITCSALKFLRGFPVVILIMVLVNSISTYGQEISTSDQEIKSAKHNATEAFNYAEKVRSTEVFSDAKSYIQILLSAAKEAKTATVNAEKLLIEQEKQISNSTNKELIENIKDQREEMNRAVEEATILYNFAEKAANANDLETLHHCSWEISKASKRIIKQAEATQRYASSSDTKK